MRAGSPTGEEADAAIGCSMAFTVLPYCPSSLPAPGPLAPRPCAGGQKRHLSSVPVAKIGTQLPLSANYGDLSSGITHTGASKRGEMLSKVAAKIFRRGASQAFESRGRRRRCPAAARCLSVRVQAGSRPREFAPACDAAEAPRRHACTRARARAHARTGSKSPAATARRRSVSPASDGARPRRARSPSPRSPSPTEARPRGRSGKQVAQCPEERGQMQAMMDRLDALFPARCTPRKSELAFPAFWPGVLLVIARAPGSRCIGWQRRQRPRPVTSFMATASTTHPGLPRGAQPPRRPRSPAASNAARRRRRTLTTCPQGRGSTTRTCSRSGRLLRCVQRGLARRCQWIRRHTKWRLLGLRPTCAYPGLTDCFSAPLLHPPMHGSAVAAGA